MLATDHAQTFQDVCVDARKNYSMKECWQALAITFYNILSPLRTRLKKGAISWPSNRILFFKKVRTCMYVIGNNSFVNSIAPHYETEWAVAPIAMPQCLLKNKRQLRWDLNPWLLACHARFWTTRPMSVHVHVLYVKVLKWWIRNLWYNRGQNSFPLAMQKHRSLLSFISYRQT